MALYSETVMEHFRHPRNVGVIEDADGIGEVGNAKCGDIMKMYLKIENGIIKDVKFKTFGCGSAIATSSIATEMIMGKTLREVDARPRKILHFGVKEAVFPFPMLPEVDPVLGPEMRSTGEVLGLADSFGLAFFKAEEAAKPPLPSNGTVLITVNPEDREAILPAAQKFVALGFKIMATTGTCDFLNAHGVAANEIAKMNEGRPNIVDAIKNGEIALVINTPIGKASAIDDSYIRKNAIRHSVPYITTVAAANAAVNGIAAFRNGDGGVKALQDYHAAIKF